MIHSPLESAWWELLICDAERVSRSGQRGSGAGVLLVVRGYPYPSRAAELPHSTGLLPSARPSFSLFYFSRNNAEVSSKISLPAYIAADNASYYVFTKLTRFHAVKTGQCNVPNTAERPQGQRAQELAFYGKACEARSLRFQPGLLAGGGEETPDDSEFRFSPRACNGGLPLRGQAPPTAGSAPPAPSGPAPRPL